MPEGRIGILIERQNGDRYIAIIDRADYGEVRKHRWVAKVSRKRRRTVYASTMVYRPDGKRIELKLHTLLTGYGQTDHKDGNGLNCTRGNMRPATNGQNGHNRGKNRSNSSGYKGVHWRSDNGMYRALIGVNSQRISLGQFFDAASAAHAYDVAAKKLHGEYARLNFPMDGPALYSAGEQLLNS